MSQSVNRRSFLSQTAAGAAAGLVVTSALHADEVAANNQVVVGVMGLSRGKSLADTFAGLPGVRVKYLCDVDQNRAESCAKFLTSKTGDVPETTDDFRRILDDKSIDALVCAAPNHWHGPATILGCAAGKHVYVEKPCSHNPHEGELMVAAARKHGRAVQMGTQRRSSPGWIEAIQRLRDGAIGRVYLARCWYNNARGSIGTGKPAEVPAWLNYELWQGPAPHVPYTNNVVHYNWHWRWHWGNGELGNNGVHTIDLCRWGLGVDYPTRVTSSGGRYHHKDDQETPDTHTVCFDFPDGKSISWQGLSCNRHGSGFVTFYGDKGSMEVQSGGAFSIYDQGDKLAEESKANDGGQAQHVANFVAAIRDNRPDSLNAEIEEAHKSTLLCHLGNIAHRTSGSLTCDASNGRILDDKQATALWKRDYEKGWEPVV